MGPTVKLLRTQTDERLVELAHAGHEAAFEAIVERYRRPLVRAARRVLPESRAEDVVQQSFLSAWRALRRGDEVRELRPWLYRIVQNTALNALRVRGYDHDELADSLRVTDAPQEEVERRDVVRRTLAGLAALPERQREALLSTAAQGRSQAEVAAAMGLTDGAVRQLVHRARHTLRAAATALMPFPAVSWLAAASTRGDVSERVAEIVAGAGAGGAAAALAKAGAVAVVAGGAITGGVVLERDPQPPARAAEVRADERDRANDGDAGKAPATTPAATAGSMRVSNDDDRRGSDSSGPGPAGSDDDDDDDRSGRRSGSEEEDDDDDDSSGPGSGTDEDSSGPGSGDDDPVTEPEMDDSSGPGSGPEYDDDDLLETDSSGSVSGSDDSLDED